MENLVLKTNSGQLVTTSKLVAEKFEKRHDNVLRDIEKLECSDEFLKLNFELQFNIRVLPNDGSTKDKLYTMTRDGFMFLAMGFTGEKAARLKEDFIKAFNEMEKALINLSQLPDFNNPAVAARAWADEYEKRILSEKQVKSLKPKAAVTDMIANATNLLTWNDAAKTLNTGRTRLLKILKERKILRNNNTPYQQYIESGYFRIKIKPIVMGDVTNDYAQTFVTGNGLTWLAKGILKLGIATEN